MKEMKAEALSSAAGSLRAGSVATFRSRLQKAGYDLSQDSELSVLSKEAMVQSVSTEVEEIVEPGTNGNGHSSVNMPENHSDPEVLPEDDATGHQAAFETEPGGEATDAGYPHTLQLSGKSPLESDFKMPELSEMQRKGSADSLSEHAASLSSVLNGVPIQASEDFLSVGPWAQQAEVGASSAMQMPAVDVGNSSAQAALDTFVQQVIDIELQMEPDQAPNLAWPGLSDDELPEPQQVPAPQLHPLLQVIHYTPANRDQMASTEQQDAVGAQAGCEGEPNATAVEDRQAVRLLDQEDEAAPRALGALCSLPHTAHSLRQPTIAEQPPPTNQLSTVQQQEEQGAIVAANGQGPAPVVVSGSDRLPRSGAALAARSPALSDIRRRCDEALYGTGAVQSQAELSQGVNALVGAFTAADESNQLSSGTFGATAAQSAKDSVALQFEPAQTAPGQDQRSAMQHMRAAMLAMQLATAQQAATSAHLQRRLSRLEGLTRSRTQSPDSPMRAAIASTNTHLHRAAAAASSDGCDPAVGQLRGGYGALSAGTAGAAGAGALDCAQLEGGHLLSFSRHMAHMEAAMAALCRRIDSLQSKAMQPMGSPEGAAEAVPLPAHASGARAVNEHGGRIGSAHLTGGEGESIHFDAHADSRISVQRSGVLRPAGQRGPGSVKRRPGASIARRIAAL